MNSDVKGRKYVFEAFIRESHLDTFGHVNNATYLTLFEAARWEFATHNGYGLEEVARTQLGPTIVEISLKFRKEIRLRERIRIESVFTQHGSRLGKVDQQMFNESGNLCCQATVTVGLFDLTKRKLVKPTEKWYRAFGVELPKSTTKNS